jgi:hypothetical protein
MKKIAGILSGLLLAASVFSQELIRNPAAPLHPDSGRVLKLELVFEISDSSGDFFFKYPNQLRLDDQKCLYILDNDELLQFSPQGKFVRNLYKKGQGPGEIGTSSSMVSFITSLNEVFVYDGVGKIIHFDGSGALAGEVKQTAGRLFRLYGMGKTGFFMQGQTNAPRSGGAAFKEIKTQAFLVSLDGTTKENILEFSSRIFEGPGFGMDWDSYKQVFNPRDGSLYVSQTCEYRVVKADLYKKQIVTSFTRNYPRVKFSLPDFMKDFYKKHNPPMKDFENDISEMFLCGDDLWVKTSTTEKDKGALFDVFDQRGRFLDSFYLNKDYQLALADGKFIYVTTHDREGNILIRKYEILNGAGI